MLYVCVIHQFNVFFAFGSASTPLSNDVTRQTAEMSNGQTQVVAASLAEQFAMHFIIAFH
jgi:hypothetical protein